jgi:hypothetical protein
MLFKCFLDQPQAIRALEVRNFVSRRGPEGFMGRIFMGRIFMGRIFMGRIM